VAGREGGLLLCTVLDSYLVDQADRLHVVSVVDVRISAAEHIIKVLMESVSYSLVIVNVLCLYL
jgi:hypothetical protein